MACRFGSLVLFSYFLLLIFVTVLACNTFSECTVLHGCRVSDTRSISADNRFIEFHYY